VASPGILWLGNLSVSVRKKLKACLPHSTGRVEFRRFRREGRLAKNVEEFRSVSGVTVTGL
jgi:hypothetical protein